MDPSGPSSSVAAVELRGVTKRFGSVTAVERVDLRVEPGEFFAMLGPSGSGKTTVLRMIAGFERPTEGAVLLDGVDVADRPPFDRDVNTVFQDYALFPHLSVAANVEYGLKVKRVPRAERQRRVADALASVRLEALGERRPNQLSGGQRQRVALARALVNRPKVLLLDEPLGALDAKLREEMQVELKQIQHDAGIAFVFVTHDQAEALSMSDRIAVFDQGRVEQVGTPREIYESPATPFVAGFVGVANQLDASSAAVLLGREVGSVVLRPERLRLGPPDPDEHGVRGTVEDIQYQGAQTRLRVSVVDPAHLVLVVDVPTGDADRVPAVGAAVDVSWPAEAVRAVGHAGVPVATGRESQ